MTCMALLRPDRVVSARKASGIDSPLQVPAFSQRDDHVLEIDRTYRFNHEVTLAIPAGCMWGRRVMVQGLHGTGKSSPIEQLAARLNRPCVRVNLDGHVSRLDLVGRAAVVIKPAPRPAFRRVPPEADKPTRLRPVKGWVKGGKSQSSSLASCPGPCSGRWRWSSTRTTPAGPT